MGRLLCVILGFAEILTGFWSNLYKVGTCLQRAHWVGPLGVRYTQVSLYLLSVFLFLQVRDKAEGKKSRQKEGKNNFTISIKKHIKKIKTTKKN